MGKIVSIFILVFIGLDIWSIFLVSDEIGGISTFALIILDLIIGYHLAASIRNSFFDFSGGEVSTKVISRLLIGFLLMFPGFFSDIIAVLLFFPPVRLVFSLGLIALLTGLMSFFYKGAGKRFNAQDLFSQNIRDKEDLVNAYHKYFGDQEESAPEQDVREERAERDNPFPKQEKNASPLERARSHFQSQRPVVNAHFEDIEEPQNGDKNKEKPKDDKK